MEVISNKNTTMKYLKKYEMRAKKKFGQNFIIDPSVVHTIANHSGTGDLVLEVGPGLGALTQKLAANYKHVLAYEIDPHMIEVLKESLESYDHVEIIHQDILKADFSKIKEVPLDICANLPYYITTPILFKLMELNIKKMTLMVQKEIGDRLMAKPSTKDYSALSIQAQYYFDIKRVMKVSKESFYPRPKVESIVIQLIPKKDKVNLDETEFFRFVKDCFQFRRKTLVNNLKAANYNQIESVLVNLGYNPQVRADSLSFESFYKIYEALRHDD